MVAGIIPTKLKPEWCDVNLPRAAKDANRMLGCIEQTEQERDYLCKTTSFADTSIKVIPESDWKEAVREKGDYTLRLLQIPTKDQNGEGSCTSNAMTSGYEYRLAATYGRRFWIEFSPMSLYQLCGTSAGGGSTLSCNMSKARESGFIPANSAANRERFDKMVLKAVGFSQRSNPRPAGWREFAINFCVEEWVKITTVEQFATCLLLNIPVLYGRSGHAILGVALVYRNGRWYVDYHNSWRHDWGDDGHGYDTLGSWLLGYGCYAPVSIKHPTIDGLHLPPTPTINAV